MPISFPTSPANGDTHVIGSITYQYDSTDDKWTGLGITPSDRLIEGSNSLEIDGTVLKWSGGNSFSFDRDDTGNSQIIKDYSSSHLASNRGSTFRIGLQDGSFGGIEVENVQGSNASFNSQATHIIRHDGGVVGDVKALSVMPWGDVGINQSSPTSQSGKVLHISGDTGGQARIHLSTSASGHGADEGHYIVSQGAESGANAGQLAFINMENRNTVFTSGSAGANATRLTIEHGGDLNIADGNLKVANGHGIDFSATTDPTSGMSSELLDDYEEGSWTPVIDNLTNTPSYDNISGRYTKIGRVVHLMGFIQIGGTTTPTYSSESSAWSMSGLPYAKSTTNSVGYVGARGIIHGQNFQYNGSFNDYGTTGVVNVAFISNTSLGLYVTGSGNGTIRGQVRRSSMKNTFIIEFDIVYNT